MIVGKINLPLHLQLKEASNESVGLAEAAGDELEPMMLGAGIDQIFGCNLDRQKEGMFVCY